jgi:hypothetical protein
MKEKITLITDAVINLILGILLLAYSPGLVSILGVPPSDNFFYPNILGAVLLGIGIALVIEAFKKSKDKYTGLGLFGAVIINICGGTVLLIWLLSGGLNLPQKGLVFLWTLDVLLLGISFVELFLELKK